MGREARFDEARHNLEAARARGWTRSQERAARVLAALGGDSKLPVERHPRFLEARAARDAGRDELAHTRVVAPAAGIVSNMRLQPGERVARGVPVFSLIESRETWIEANFKETQLAGMREGQEVTVVADAYPGCEWRGARQRHRARHRARVRAAAAAERERQLGEGGAARAGAHRPRSVPDGQTPLRAGMTVTVRVDTGHVRSLSALR